MAGRIDARLAELGIVLPAAMMPAGNYSATVIAGNQLFVSGMVPMDATGLKYQGRLGETLSVADGQAAARLAALSIVALVRQALAGDLDRVQRCLRLVGFVNCTPAFAEHSKVINGATDVIFDIFGEAGRHTRAAYGASSLPFNVAVEIETTWQIS